MTEDNHQKIGEFWMLCNPLSISASRLLRRLKHPHPRTEAAGRRAWMNCVGNENTIRRDTCKRNRMRSRKPCRIGGKIHILEAHADHEMMSLTHVGLRKNAKPGPEKTRPPKVLEPKQENKNHSTQRQDETPTPHARLEQQKA